VEDDATNESHDVILWVNVEVQHVRLQENNSNKTAGEEFKQFTETMPVKMQSMRHNEKSGACYKVL
jgi:hypothetical protein